MTTAIEALLSYQQADEDGVMVITSRQVIHEVVADIEQARKGLEAGIRSAKLALFVIRKQGVMPNSSWESGFNADLKTAEEALAALPHSP